MNKPQQLLVALCVLLCHGAIAEVFKCVDDLGNATYQDTDCTKASQRSRVDHRFSNSLSLGFSKDDEKVINEIAKESKALARQRVKSRNAWLKDRAQQIREKQQACAALKDDYNEMRVRHRRYGRSDPDAENDLTRRMREACSG